MSDIRADVSAIIGIRVEPGEYQDAFNKLDIHGKPSQKELRLLIIKLIEHVERLETHLQPSEK